MSVIKSRLVSKVVEPIIPHLYFFNLLCSDLQKELGFFLGFYSCLSIGFFKILPENSEVSKKNIATEAIRDKHLALFKWLHHREYPIHNDASSIAVAGLDLGILKFMHKKRLSISSSINAAMDTHSICNTSAKAGKFDVLEWAISVRFEWDDRTCAHIAEHGSIERLQEVKEILIWLDTRMPYRSHLIPTAAIKNGHLTLFKWMELRKYKISDKICDHAVESGSLESLQYLHYRGYKVTRHTFISAADRGNIEIMKWLKSNTNCPIDDQVWILCMNKKEVLEFLLELGIPKITITRSRVFELSIKGYLDKIPWFYEHGFELVDIDCIHEIAPEWVDKYLDTSFVYISCLRDRNLVYNLTLLVYKAELMYRDSNNSDTYK